MFFKRKAKKNRTKRKGVSVRRVSITRKHYEDHREFAREIIHEHLLFWNQHYNFEYKRVAIKNQKRCWGSCSEHGNLNFNYKIVFLPEALMDYIIVHELCHLAELNHSPVFWAHVERTIPDYRARRVYLKKMTHVPQKGFPSSRAYSRTL